jgi:chaperonin GroES
VLVIADAPETKTAGGILLTTGAGPGGPGSSVTGSVSAIGADVKAVKAGDKVLVNGFAGSDIELEDGSKGKFLTEDDILAVVS